MYDSIINKCESLRDAVQQNWEFIELILQDHHLFNNQDMVSIIIIKITIVYTYKHRSLISSLLYVIVIIVAVVVTLVAVFVV